LVPVSYWPNSFVDFTCHFLIGDEYTGILLQLLKSGMGTLLAFEKLDKLLIGF